MIDKPPTVSDLAFWLGCGLVAALILLSFAALSFRQGQKKPGFGFLSLGLALLIMCIIGAVVLATLVQVHPMT